jgi:hypothetical protein
MLDDEFRLEIGRATSMKDMAYKNLRLAQARLQDAAPGPDREAVRADVDHWMEQHRVWLRAEYTAVLNLHRRRYVAQ